MGEEERLKTIVGEALRGYRFSTHQYLAAIKLISAARIMDELARIRLICRAALAMLDDCRAAGFQLDGERIRAIAAVARALSETEPQTVGNHRLRTVRWGFPLNEVSFKAYIEWWWNVEPAYYAELLAECRETWIRLACVRCGATLALCLLEDWINNTVSEKTRRFGVLPNPALENGVCPICGQKLTQSLDSWERLYLKLNHGVSSRISMQTIYRLNEDAPLWLRFFDITVNALSEDGYQTLKNSFIEAVEAEIAEIEAAVAKSIEPEVWRQALQFMQAEEPSAEAAEEEAASESPMG